MDQCLIRFPGFGRKARDDVTEILRIELRLFRDLAGEKSFTKRTKRNKANAQFLARRQDFLFRLSPPQRIFVLQSSHGLEGVSPTHVFHPSFEKAKLLYLALLNQLPPRTRHVFDRHVWIDAMLI